LVIIIEGPLHAGKTTRVRALVETLAAMHVPLSGYLSPSVRNGEGITGYDLEVIGRGEAAPLLRRKSDGEKKRRGLDVGSFRFVPAGLERAREIVKKSGPGDFLVVDEVGPAELEGKGVWPELGPSLEEPGRRVLLVVRESILEDLLGRLQKRPLVVRFDAADFEKRILAEISR
jgi:nucleoside-triphosphatase THEP1